MVSPGAPARLSLSAPRGVGPEAWEARARAWAARSLVGLSLVVASCGAPPRPARSGTLRARRAPAARVEASACAPLTAADGPRLCALATLDPDDAAMDVRLRLEPAALPAARREVRLAFRASLGEGYVEEAIEAPAGGWPASLGALSAPVELAYRVRLDGAARPGGSWARQDGFHVTGASLLPRVLVDGAEVEVPATLVLDVGDLPLATSAGTEPRVFDAADLARLADEAYEIGPLASTRREVRSTVLVVATSEPESEPRLERVADELARAMDALSEHLGPPSTDAVLVVFHPSPEGEGEEPVVERLGAALVHRGALPTDPQRGLAQGSMHELGHLWIPGSHEVPEAWLAEGITDYLAVLALEALAGASRADRARLVLRRHARYEAAAEGRTLMTASADAPWVEDAGLLAGFCLDAHLAESGSSLAAVLRTTLAREEEELGIEALLADLASVSGEAASHLEALAVHPGAFALDGCLERFGFHVRRVTFEGPADAALARDVLGGVRATRGLDDAAGLEVREVEEGSPLAVGDVLMRVADRPVDGMDELAYAVHALPEGARFEIAFRRDGEARVLARELPARGADETVERTILEVVEVER